MVTGMTCGSCAARIERRLNRLDGVSATVNYATGRAYFTASAAGTRTELIGVIKSTGLPGGPARAAGRRQCHAPTRRAGTWSAGWPSAFRWPSR